MKFDERVCWSDLQLGDGIVGQAAVALEPVLVENTASDPRYIESMPGIQSEVAVPLLLKGKLVGILDLESVSAARFGADDVSTLTLLAPQVAAAIENARLHEETVAKERRLAADLIAARALQNHLLPAAPERVSGLEVAARNAPASMVSGDFYDFYQRNGWFGFVNADVSGKGAAAAIYAALASGVFRTFAGPGRSPAETLACVNQSLADRQIEGQFVAATFGVWNAERGLLEMAGAGMPYPCVIRGGRPEAAEMPGLPLGLFRDATYETKRFALCPGDIVLSVSDGFSEGGGPSGDAHGEQRILDFVADRCGMPAKQIVDEMFDTLRASNGDGGQWDDETAIVMKVAA